MRHRYLKLLTVVLVLSVIIQFMRSGELDSSRSIEGEVSFVLSPAAVQACNYAANCGVCVQHHQCMWCAETLSCIDASTSTCSDVETYVGGCSAVFLFSIPAQHRVIYVGKRSGGPEALVQLHLALLHWNFNSTLETRKRQVGKSLLPFFRDTYASEFSKFGVRMVKNEGYRDFLASGRGLDLLILTETWPCQQGLRFDQRFGARQLQYHLTAQNREFTYNVSHLYIPRADPEECSVFTHTHFMTNVFLNQSTKSTIVPFVSPHILAAGNRFLASAAGMSASRTVILYDGDAGFDASLVDIEFRKSLVKAASIKPHVLYKLFEKTLCVIDFAMPGAERLVLEASLFGAVVIISDELNGRDAVDFPIPEKYRLSGRNYTQLNQLLRELTESQTQGTSSRFVAQFETFRQYVRHQRTEFYRSVRRYFSDSAHFILPVGPSSELSEIAPLVASILVHAPLATVSVCFENDSDAAKFLRVNNKFIDVVSSLYLRASLSFTSTSTMRVPQQALLILQWRELSCFPSTYDFLSVVATAYHQLHQAEASGARRSFAAVSALGCFNVWHHYVKKPSLLATLGTLMLNQSIVARTSSELDNIPHLRDDALWRKLRPFFL